MTERSWISHYIVPCPGNATCKHCKPGERHSPQQHVFSKLVRDLTPKGSMPSAGSYVEAPNVKHEKYLRSYKLMGTLFGNLDLVPFDPKIDPKPYACFICWSSKHLTRQCRKKPTHVYCRNCGRKDVELKKCPRCARAYREYYDKIKRTDRQTRRLGVALNKARSNYREEDLKYDDDLNDTEKTQENGEARKVRFVEEDGRDDFENSRKITSPDSVVKCKVASLDEMRKEKAEIENERLSDINENNESSSQSSVLANFDKDSVVSTITSNDEAENLADLLEDDFKSADANSIGELESASSEKLERNGTSISLSPTLTSDEYPDSYEDAGDIESNKLFTFMRNKKIQDHIEAAHIDREPKLNSLGDSEPEYYFYEDEEEDYDDVLVDEDERSESLSSEDYVIQEFLDLLDALKHLTIEMQNIAVLDYVSNRKKQGWKPLVLQKIVY